MAIMLQTVTATVPTSPSRTGMSAGVDIREIETKGDDLFGHYNL